MDPVLYVSLLLKRIKKFAGLSHLFFLLSLSHTVLLLDRVYPFVVFLFDLFAFLFGTFLLFLYVLPLLVEKLLFVDLASQNLVLDKLVVELLTLFGKVARRLAVLTVRTSVQRVKFL